MMRRRKRGARTEDGAAATELGDLTSESERDSDGDEDGGAGSGRHGVRFALYAPESVLEASERTGLTLAVPRPGAAGAGAGAGVGGGAAAPDARVDMSGAGTPSARPRSSSFVARAVARGTGPAAKQQSKLILAARAGDAKDLEARLHKYDHLDPNWHFGDGWSPLFYSVDRAAVECTHVMLMQPAIDVDAVERSGATALLVAVDACVDEKVHDAETVVGMLLRAGANVNTADDNGTTPLHVAAKRGALGAARMLLEYFADVDPRKRVSLQTPLHKAAETGHSLVVRLLVDAGADIEARDAMDQTPLHAAAKAGQRGAALALIEGGADAQATSAGGSGATPVDYARRRGGEGAMYLARAMSATAHSRRRMWLVLLCRLVILGRAKPLSKAALAQQLLPQLAVAGTPPATSSGGSDPDVGDGSEARERAAPVSVLSPEDAIAKRKQWDVMATTRSPDDVVVRVGGAAASEAGRGAPTGERAGRASASGSRSGSDGADGAGATSATADSGARVAAKPAKTRNPLERRVPYLASVGYGRGRTKADVPAGAPFRLHGGSGGKHRQWLEQAPGSLRESNDDGVASSAASATTSKRTSDGSASSGGAASSAAASVSDAAGDVASVGAVEYRAQQAIMRLTSLPIALFARVVVYL